MDILQSAEIHFHEQEKASVFTENNCVGDAEKFAEIAFFMFYSIRQMSNLGVNQISDSLAADVLLQLGANIEWFASGKTTGGLQLGPYPGYQGRKRFLAKLHLTDEKARFDLKAKGFGLLTRDVGFYVPISVLALIYLFFRKRKDDPEYLRKLANGAEFCGGMQLNRNITLVNHARLIVPLLPIVCEEYMESAL